MSELVDLLAPWVAVITLVSLASLLLVALVGARIIASLPEDYFIRGRMTHHGVRHPLVHIALIIVKNVVGTLLILAGLAMLVLPGQGILTLLMGILLIDFPGKFDLERWLISRRGVLDSVNWLRQRSGRPPLRLVDRDDVD